MNGISVIMPTYNQAAYIRRAIKSLLAQTYEHWELIIINDGATDETGLFVHEFLADNRITYLVNETNKGLGEALNRGIDAARYDYIAYLPSDDYYYPLHLELLSRELSRSEEIALVYSEAQSQIIDSLSYHVNGTIHGLFNQRSLQLVQVAHKKTSDRWVTRKEWVTDDLFEMFWQKLTKRGVFSFVSQISCCWTIHPFQRHKLINEKLGGGLNIYRQYYHIKEPVKLKLSELKFIDEEQLYERYRKPVVKSDYALKILLVGELAYNPERIYALEERGHQLYGLWMKRPSFGFTTVGPLPFGHVTDIAHDQWEEKIKEIKPDIIYALLNFGAVPLAYEVMTRFPSIPFVWHFKEGPSFCMANGMWDELIRLYSRANGKIYINPEVKDWFELFIPSSGHSFILDGDLPKIDCFTEEYSPRLSARDGEIHTVVPGRMIGVTPDDILFYAKEHIHIHVYIENYLSGQNELIKRALQAVPDYFHLHPNCSSKDWVREFSRYDAGWLHCFQSQNEGNLMLASWDDLNIPARMNTLAAAGLPMIQKDNTGHIVAMQSRIKKINAGIFFRTNNDLSRQLHDKNLMDSLRQNICKYRESFCFDYYADELIRFFREVIQHKKDNNHV